MGEEIWTIGRILKWTEQYFTSKGIETPRLDGEVLLSHMLNKERIYCYSHYDQPLTPAELEQFRRLIKRRIEGYSVATITGRKEFMGLPFMVNEHVLIPRPDTETLVEGLLNILNRSEEYRILDLCTGTGAILYSLLHYLPKATGIGVDISSHALEVAKENRSAFELADRAELIKSDLLEAVPEEAFDIVTSNPPYIPSGDVDTLSAEVLHEPRLALDGGISGLDFYKRIISNVSGYIKTGGLLAIEIGVGQEEDIQQLAIGSDVFETVSALKDLNGLVRTLVFRKK